MSLGQRIIDAIEARRDRKRKSASGPYGDYYRSGGKALLYDLPVTTGSLVIDAGGYEGEWSAQMMVRYGCRSEIFEPFPVYAGRCELLFGKNALVHVHAAALGGESRTANFTISADGTSEFSQGESSENVQVKVVDVAEFFISLGEEPIACLKLNIEGGEYEVLERLLETSHILRCNSILVQFHRQPEGWSRRLTRISNDLSLSHTRVWSYPMIWEKWVKKNL